MIKHIIPAVASTNAIIAAACVTEAFKLATSCHKQMKNYMVFNDTEGIYSYTYEQEKNPTCIVCSNVPITLEFAADDCLQKLLDFLCSSVDYQMKSPALTTTDEHSKNRTLYMQNIPYIEEQTRPNLKRSFHELGIRSGQQLYVADQTCPTTLIFTLKLH